MTEIAAASKYFICYARSKASKSQGQEQVGGLTGGRPSLPSPSKLQWGREGDHGLLIDGKPRESPQGSRSQAATGHGLTWAQVRRVLPAGRGAAAPQPATQKPCCCLPFLWDPHQPRQLHPGRQKGVWPLKHPTSISSHPNKSTLSHPTGETTQGKEIKATCWKYDWGGN